MVLPLACTVDPDFAPAHRWLARVSAGLVAQGSTDHEAADLREGVEAPQAPVVPVSDASIEAPSLAPADA